MNQNSSQDIVPKEEAFLRLRELDRTYPELMAHFLQSLKVKCDSTEGIREGKWSSHCTCDHVYIAFPVLVDCLIMFYFSA